MGRIFITFLLAAAMWHILLPAVAIEWWLLLGTLRQLISRLPFVPNKDIVFAGAAALLVGRSSEIVAAMALMATLVIAAHLLMGAVLGGIGLAQDAGLHRDRRNSGGIRGAPLKS